jgi:calcium/calmodulin-dependent protein kinase I
MHAAKKVDDISELYDLGKELGSGGFSVVKQATGKDDHKLWALKLIQMPVFRKHQAQAEKEVDILAGLDHSGVVKLKEVVLTKQFFTIVMEVLSGGELFDRIVTKEKYNEADAKVVARTMFETLKYLHQLGIVHRDLKPENFVFDKPGDDANLKLTDFGFAAPVNPRAKLTTSCGTPEYVAPEILNQEPYGFSVDMWSAGVILYILLCGCPPFYGKNDEELYEKICRCQYRFFSPQWDSISPHAKDLIRHLLEVDTTKRYTAAQALEHPWFGQHEHVDLKNALAELRRYNATRKLRKGVLTIMAITKMRSVVSGGK